MLNLKKGQHIFIAFQNGKAVLDSQLQPRMCTSLENVDRWTPTVNKGKIEYVEYAPTTTPPNEPLTCEGGIHLKREKNRAAARMSREQVEKMWKGEWEFPIFADEDAKDPRCKCSKCGSIETPFARHHFCPNCGAPMTDEAVQMVMERLEALHETI